MQNQLMCYAIIELTWIGLKQPLVTGQSQDGRLDKLSQHAIAQSQTRKARHTIPACNNIDKLSSMQSPNHRQGKLDMLSQHAVEANHRPGKSDMLPQHTQYRQAIPACTAKYVLYKRGCKSPKQLTS